MFLMSYIILGFSALTGNPGVNFEPKRFIARKGRPDKIYSDNGSTCVSAAG